MRYAARVDSIQPECVALWRRHGKKWIPTHRQGDGVPDGFLMHKGLWLAVEVKTGNAPLKPKQKELHDEVAAKGGKVYVIRSLDEAAALIGAQ